MPEFDPGLHAGFSFLFRDQISAGHPFAWFNDWTQYPPLVHLIGALVTFVTGKGIWPGVVAQNLIFVPLLAAGCYGAAKIVYRSELAGFLAVVFALGTPMIVSQFHEFMLDAPETAMVAASVWLVLASAHFERVGTAALAGLAVGFGFLVKESFPAFIAGAVVVAAAQGLWRRNWRGLLVFVAVAAVIALPWYIHHWGQVRALSHIASANGNDNSPGSQYPTRYSTKNAGWFLWSALNYQNYAPMLLFATVGAVVAVVQLVKRPWRYPLTLEILAGGLVAWAGATYSLPHDPRYSLPGLPYLAILGAGWVTMLRPRWRLVAAAVLCAFAFANVFAISTGFGRRVAITLPGAPKASGLHERQLTILSDKGYTYNAPHRSGDLLGMMRALHKRGIRYIAWNFAQATLPQYNNEGLSALANAAGLKVGNSPRKPPTDGVVLEWGPVTPNSCRRLYNSTGVTPVIPLKRPVDACPH
ncbi:MAG TPA: glycosyltransferase family 39 protein [Thermoleophilaceae bacterium]|nr:glycosyltransferase family 39 protein [Thermoleophilaceae bacterium]